MSNHVLNEYANYSMIFIYTLSGICPMVQIDLASYKSLYLQTAKEYVDKMFVCLGELIKDALDKEALNNLHIASHSLKSQSQVMGFSDIAEACLSVEKISDEALKGNGELTSDVIASIKSLVNKSSEMLKQIQHDTGEQI